MTQTAEKSSAVTKVEQSVTPAPSASPTPSQLIQLAVQQNLDIDKLERLMIMQEKFEANAARRDFFQALADFQSIVPVITKNKKADFTPKSTGMRVAYQYATLDAIISQIQLSLKACGLSYQWKFDEDKEKQKIVVTCNITHVHGHQESTTMSGAADTSGTKNAIQSSGSTLTYLQRYTLIGALGLGTAQDDVDGRNKKDTHEQEEDYSEIKEQLLLMNSKEEMLKYFEQDNMKQYHQNDKVLKLFSARRIELEKKAKPAAKKAAAAQEGGSAK